MKKIKARIFEILTDPPEGDRVGNVIFNSILILIAVNVLVCIVETVESLGKEFPEFFYWFEVISVAIFTAEYVLRLWACTASGLYSGPVRGRVRLIFKPIYLIDIFAILPLYLQVIVPGLDLRFVRALRLFRLFRLFRFDKLTESFQMFSVVLRKRFNELVISLVVVFLSVVIASYVMYMLEHGAQPEKFSSVPAAMWWGIVTMTTIGYGDLYPITPSGKLVGGIVAFFGLCVLALPIATIGAGFMDEIQRKRSTEWGRRTGEMSSGLECPHCGKRIQMRVTSEIGGNG